MDTLRNRLSRPLPSLLLALLLASCAAIGPRKEPKETAVYAVSGAYLLNIPPAGGMASGVRTFPRLRDVSALAYDPKTGTVYGIADASDEPKLVTLDRTTGQVEVIGPVTVTGGKVKVVESLAFDPKENLLYAAGSRFRHPSDRLFVLDTSTAEAREVVQVSGTVQNDVDGLAIVGGVFYGVDEVTGSSTLYRIDVETGEATALGESIPMAVTELAYDPTNRRLLGIVKAKPLAGVNHGLLAIALDGGSFTPLGPVYEEGDFGNQPLSALVVAPSRAFDLARNAKIFADGFETKGKSAWAKVKER